MINNYHDFIVFILLRRVSYFVMSDDSFNFIHMSHKSRSLHLKQKAQGQQSIMQDIEQSLIKNDMRIYFGIDEFQKLFEKKKLIVDTIGQYHSKNKESLGRIIKTQQRLYKMQQLADQAEKQAMLMKNQIDKINDAHMMTKILTIEKMIKAKMEHDELQKRKNTIFRIREEKNRASLLNRSRNQYKTQKLRQMSLLQSKILKQCLDQRKFETIEQKKTKANRVRQQKERVKDRIRRYQQFKVDQGRKNYLNKMNTLKQALQQREKKLDHLYRQEVKQQKNFSTTEHVTKQYLSSLFPTETL